MVRDELKAPLYTAAAVLVIATLLFIAQKNYEFLFYVAVLAALGAVVARSDRHVHYPQWLVWLLLAWGAMHMAGGAVIIDGAVLYAHVLFELVGEPYNILKYDQVVHAYGYFVATAAMHYVLKPHLNPQAGAFAVALTLLAAGVGLGAANEIIEFFAVILVPETGVGGYTNTLLDLCFNALGAAAAVAWLHATGQLKHHA